MFIKKKSVSKNLRKVTLIFSFATNPFYGQNYEKQKGPGTSYQFFLGLQSDQKNSYF